jgi:hypothetical protein
MTNIYPVGVIINEILKKSHKIITDNFCYRLIDVFMADKFSKKLSIPLRIIISFWV